jgi:phosphoglycolate phosphatase
VIRFHRRFDPSRIRLLIFDLDGTLIDSRLDLVHSVNAMLRHLHRPELPETMIASYVGDGAPMLVQRALGDPKDEALFDAALHYFLDYYRKHKLDHTHLYPGVKESLAAIQNSRNGFPRKMAVLSNKPVRPARAIVEAMELVDFFAAVYGGDSFPTKKPDPEGAQRIVNEIGTRPEETVIIGDSSVDVVTGRNAGLWTCGVTYGFAPHTLEEVPPDVVVDAPSELGDVFGQCGARRE